MGQRQWTFGILALIVVVAALLRFYDLTRADVITDEALIGFRSIGYIDFVVSPDQTTPYEWFSDTPPGWLKLSFHDHPPLIFALQHFIFSILGVSLLSLRLLFVLAGIGSVIISFFIGRALFDDKVGLIASLLLAVSQYHVWVSRIGLQESVVIFFLLLTFYLFIRALETGRHWWWGIGLGAALLTKYTAIVVVPIIVAYLILFRRDVFRNKNFWFAVAIATVIFSPVLIYNIKLYQARGHFDLQLSYLFGQGVAEWQYLPGKIQAGSFIDRLVNLIPSLYRGMLWPMFVLFILSFLFSWYRLVGWWRKNQAKISDFSAPKKAIILLILAIFFQLFLFLLTGPQSRFVATIVPFVVLLIAWFLGEQKKLVWSGVVILLVLGELFFVGNTLFAATPIGQQGVTYSYLRIESNQWGYNQLDQYLNQLLKNKKPGLSFPVRYSFLEAIKQQGLEKADRQNKEATSLLLIYDPAMYDMAVLWSLHRRMIYDGWPVITAETYLENGRDFWRQQGITDFYYLKILDDAILLNPDVDLASPSHLPDDELIDRDGAIIKRPDGREVFSVYRF